MAVIGETRFLERQQFFNGQRLFASDLQELEELNREMRWLHNQSLHQPGVGSGFAVTGEAGASEALIGPGYAIDSAGREIVLTETATEPVPPVADDGFGEPAYYDLTVAYPDDRDLEESETRDGVCLPRGVVRLEEEPVFCWVRLGPPPALQPVDSKLKDDIESAKRIRLARAEVFNCQLKSKLSTAERLDARPTVQPFVTCGRSPLPELVPGENFFLVDEGFHFRIAVDTAEAGFRTSPCYHASLAGPRNFELGGEIGSLVVDGLTSLSTSPESELTAFQFSFLGFLFQPEGGEGAGAILAEEPARSRLLEALRQAWRVEWIGVEGGDRAGL